MGRAVEGWAAVQALRRGREPYAAGERVLGSSAFVEALHREIAAQHPDPRPTVSLDTILQRVNMALGVPPTARQEGSRRSSLCRAREGIAYLALDVGGYPGPLDMTLSPSVI